MAIEQNFNQNIPKSSETKVDEIELFTKNEQLNIADIVSRVQNLYLDSAIKYLPQGELQNVIIDFYSDTERLSRELTNIFKNDSKSEVNEKLDAISEMFNDKEFFIKKVSSKIEVFQSTTERANGFVRRDKRMKENPLASQEEYEAGTYKDSLEYQVADAVFALRKKGYITFESGMDEKITSRDQFIGVYNKKIFLPTTLVEDLRKKGFHLSLNTLDDRTQIRIRPLIENVPLSKWKEIWDEVSENLPEAPDEDLSNLPVWKYHKQFRDFQDELRKS